jgi:hypothetical protein
MLNPLSVLQEGDMPGRREGRAAFIVLGVSLLLVFPALFACGGQSGAGSSPATAVVSDRDRAIAAAEQLYAQQKAQGVDFSQGPCLSDEVIPDWAADVAHNPRQPVDDQPQNQCASYRAGKTHHFVELDPEGNLIRAQ